MGKAVFEPGPADALPPGYFAPKGKRVDVA